MKNTTRVDHLLTNGPLPPGPAFDIAIAVAAHVAKARSPVGAVSVRPDRVRIDADGVVQVALLSDPDATTAGDAHAIAALLCELLVGMPYRQDQHALQMHEIKSALELWPGGSAAISTVDELLRRDPRASPAEVHERLVAARSKLGGSPLVAWLRNVHGTPQPASRYGTDPMNPELATGMIPVGALARLVADANRGSATPTAVDFRPGDLKPGDLKAVVKAVTGAPPAATPIPEPRSPRPNVTRRSGPSASLVLSGVVLWGLTVVLLAIALLLVWFLLH